MYFYKHQHAVVWQKISNGLFGVSVLLLVAAFLLFNTPKLEAMNTFMNVCYPIVILSAGFSSGFMVGESYLTNEYRPMTGMKFVFSFLILMFTFIFFQKFSGGIPSENLESVLISFVAEMGIAAFIGIVLYVYMRFKYASESEHLRTKAAKHAFEVYANSFLKSNLQGADIYKRALEKSILPYIQSLSDRNLIMSYIQDLENTEKGLNAGKSLLNSAECIEIDKV